MGSKALWDVPLIAKAAVAKVKNIGGSFRGTSSLIVVDCAPRVLQFKSKEPLRTDYFAANLTKWTFLCVTSGWL